VIALRSMRSFSLVLIVAACLAAGGLAGCGSSSSSSSASSSGASSSSGAATSTSSGIHLAKTKFLLHAGLGFGAFHRYIYKPFKAGDFSHPLSHKLTLVKAGLAALYVKREIRLAAQDVHASPTLSKLFSPLTAVADQIGALTGKIKRGNVSSSDIDGTQSRLQSIRSTAASKGQMIQDKAPAPAQLAGAAG